MEGLQNTTKTSVRIIGASAETQTEDLGKRSQKEVGLQFCFLKQPVDPIRKEDMQYFYWLHSVCVHPANVQFLVSSLRSFLLLQFALPQNTV
jgi:hypothetical protein